MISEHLLKFILDLLFPIKCLFCKKEGLWICSDCENRFILQTDHICGICEKVICPDGLTCHRCKRRHPLDALLSATHYQSSGISQAIHFFKYRFIKDLQFPLGNLLVKALKKTDLPLPDMIIPVPLHPKRLRWRGFNQSELLAKFIAKNLLPFNEIVIENETLVRKKHTQAQMKMKDFHLRKTNIADAFAVTNNQKVKDKTILLVDDVATTGATIFECAKILKHAGAKKVYAVVIARQEIKR